MKNTNKYSIISIVIILITLSTASCFLNQHPQVRNKNEQVTEQGTSIIDMPEEQEELDESSPNGAMPSDQYEVEDEELGSIIQTYIQIIHPNVPPIQFDISVYEKKQDNGFCYYWIGVTTIRQYETGEILQVIDGLDIPQANKRAEFELEDLNFDGYKDMRIRTTGTANLYSHCWLYSSEANKFIYDPDLFVSNIEVDEENQFISSHERWGGGQHSIRYYRFIDGKLTAFKEIRMGFSDESSPGDYDITYELIDGEWIETDRKPTSLKG